jgi:S-formylglutathione hydrolase FrmB
MNRLLSLGALFSFVTLAACGGDDIAQTNDAGSSDDGGNVVVDAGPCSNFVPQNLSMYAPVTSAAPGTVRTAYVRLGNDFCESLTATLASSSPNVATVASTVDLPRGITSVPVEIEALAAGQTTITVTMVRGTTPYTATLDFEVREATVPACTGSASGRIDAGDRIEVAAGTSLAGASLALQEGASRLDDLHVDGFDGTIGCAADQIPEGYRALGPAVTFGPTTLRALREMPVAIPVNLALLPSNAGKQHVEIAYTGPSIPTAHIVPFASHEHDGDLLRFLTPRLGTFQAVVKVSAGETRMRNYTFRGITGFSMGAMGTATIAGRHPELFDFAAPLGGPTDYAYSLKNFHDYIFGGFCTEEERILDAAACEAGATMERTPENDILYQRTQDFEHWAYDDGREGQGGTFDRSRWQTIFRDFASAFGNPNTNHTADGSAQNILPPGVPQSFRDLSPSERCANPIVFAPYNPDAAGSGFFDNEYNPEGQYPVITFCDGSEVPTSWGRDIGIWNPDPAAPHGSPVDLFLAVDINGNGRRDQGEPVVRNFWEPFDDFGVDNLPSYMEPAYNALTNPDPAGDDYDFQFNPSGTENNWVRDGEPCALAGGERFDDFGLDGVDGTAQLGAGGYDSGESDGCFTRARGTERMQTVNGKHGLLTMPESEVHRMDFFTDAGIRDFLNSAPSMSAYFGALGARGRSLRLVNRHEWMHLAAPDFSQTFDFSTVDYSQLGSSVLVRYGLPDATEQELIEGDGGHVGTVNQLIHRVQSVIAWMSARWPDGDRGKPRNGSTGICMEGQPGCVTPNQFVFDFTSSDGRTGPAAVITPPGYSDPENADKRYPVIYFLHGYGMEPAGLVSTAIFFYSYMISSAIPEHQRLAKAIFVFPDGNCRGNECSTGTFYADAPEENRAAGAPLMETWMLDLMEHIDENYRTKAPAEFEETL